MTLVPRPLLTLLPVLFMPLAGCGVVPAVLLPNESTEIVDGTRFALLTKFVHISDAQIVDEESPGRLVAFAGLTNSAWRAQEVYSTQLLDGMVRTVNKLHTVENPFDFLIHTGDALDNAQRNELDWFVTLLEGGRVDPRSGPDDRATRPDPLLDPHEPFDAPGLYRNGVHGDLPTIDWYSLIGNHDRFGIGVFPIVNNIFGNRVSPLPLMNRAGLFAPRELDPAGSLAVGLITPANPGPPPEVSLPALVRPNDDRRYITDREFVAAHWRQGAQPPGHGFDPPEESRTWYSVSPAIGVRLISINTSAPPLEIPSLVYVEGAVSSPQVAFLEAELTAADEAGEVAIVATHHPAGSLDVALGSALSEAAFVALLNRHPSVKLHLAGHWHTNLVVDRGGYTELVTSAVIDAPQEGRVVEVWRESAPVGEPEVLLRYRQFSHLDEIEPLPGDSSDVFDDPYLPMRRIAADLAGVP